jgi:predicted nucleic acid-binding protein
MGLVIRIEGRKLGAAAKAAFEAAEAGNGMIYVPAMALAEILYLAGKRKIGITLYDAVSYFGRYPRCQQYPMSFAVIEAAAQVHDIPELHDRLIAGTARLLQRDLITNDPVIRASTCVSTVW